MRNELARLPADCGHGDRDNCDSYILWLVSRFLSLCHCALRELEATDVRIILVPRFDRFLLVVALIAAVAALSSLMLWL
jgi:hypothetical protein